MYLILYVDVWGLKIYFLPIRRRTKQKTKTKTRGRQEQREKADAGLYFVAPPRRNNAKADDRLHFVAKPQIAILIYIYIRQLSKQVLHTRDRFGRRQFIFFLLFFPPHPVYYLHTYFTPLPPINSRNSDPGSHTCSKLFFFPLPLRLVP